MDICVVGKQDAVLAQYLAKQLQAPFYSFTHDYFADTESTIDIPCANAVNDKIVFIVYQFHSPSREAAGERSTCINHQFLDLLFLVRKLKYYRPKRIIIVLPYLPYARQEKKVDDGMASNFELMLAFLQDAGADAIIACDIHTKAEQYQMLHHILLTDLWTTFLQSYMSQHKQINQDLCIVSPDQGGIIRAHALAEALHAKVAFAHKERPEKDRIFMHDLTGDVAGKTVIIIDDILDTGRTAAQACQIVKTHGAVRVIGCFSHAVLSSGALVRLQESYFDEIFFTNTLILDATNLPNNVHVMPITSYLTQKIEYFAQHFMYRKILCKPHLIRAR